MKKSGIILILFSLILSACGTTSQMRAPSSSSEKASSIRPDFTSYDTVIINDFTVEVKKTDNMQAANESGKKFADILTSQIIKSKAFANVERNKNTNEKAIVIEGNITRYEEGKAALRFLVGFGAGSSNFDAKVIFKDNHTNKHLSEIIVDKQSWALGGAFAGSQDVQSHMISAAEIISNEMKLAKNNSSK